MIHHSSTYRVLPDVDSNSCQCFLFSQRVIIKAALPQCPTWFQYSTPGCHLSFEQANKLNDIFVLQQQMNVVRHYTPSVESRLTLRSQINQKSDSRIGQFNIRAEPWVPM